ncbi:hypothetical protein [Desulfatitalea alkaliphila]|uniref:Uncharacterized protein n=1 Tax=Desulfatitalea alkaliphila TaxID=2929485 RepID=A0AA41UK98_9BACT|nr:hypothetical protein [Desulfatitalea alkaliphila]MCJ8501222.1 hypothetical protein [Desulfatitalea alkaliphila]
MKEKLYAKEILVTIIFTIVLLIFGHFAQLFVLFPSLQSGTMWGFPVHYILPILMGWFGLLVVTIIMALVLNRLDDEIDQYGETNRAAAKGGQNQ